MSFPLNYQTLLELDITPDEATATYARVAAGISGFDPSTNDDVDQTKYLDGNGFASSDVIGAQYTMSLSGHRVVGDPVQDWLESIQLELGDDRKTTCRMTDAIGNVKTGSVTIANIDFGGGDAGAKEDISFEIHFNGKPTRTPKAAAAALSTVIAPGTTDGTTTATATATGSLAYKLGGSTFGTLYAGQYISGYTDYTSGDEIAASVGQFLLVMDLNSNGRVVSYSETELDAADFPA